MTLLCSQLPSFRMRQFFMLWCFLGSYALSQGFINVDFDTSAIDSIANQPDGPDGLRYNGIATSGATTIDLIVTAGSGYKAFNSSQNGKNGSFGQINLMEGISSQFTFQFVDSADDSPFVLDAFNLSFLDIDKSGIIPNDGQGVETLIVETPGQYEVRTDNYLNVTAPTGFDTFTNTTTRVNANDDGSGGAIPASAALGNEQEKAAVEFTFTNRSLVVFDFAVANQEEVGGDIIEGSGRNFLFTGSIDFDGDGTGGPSTYVGNIPEPSFYAAFLGLAALFALIRKRAQG